MKKKLLAVLLVASMATSIVACGNKGQKPSSSNNGDGNATAEATTINTDTTTLKINLASEPDYLDPTLNSSTDGAALALNSFVGLYTLDENNTPVPALADGEPEVSEDGKHYTIKLIKFLPKISKRFIYYISIFNINMSYFSTQNSKTHCNSMIIVCFN